MASECLLVVFMHDNAKGSFARENLVENLQRWRAAGNTGLSTAEKGTYQGTLALIITTPQPHVLENQIIEGLSKPGVNYMACEFRHFASTEAARTAPWVSEGDPISL